MASELSADINSYMDFPSFDFLVSMVVIVLLAWFAWDMNSSLKASQRKNQLGIEGRWRDLERHFERVSNTRRPFLWLHQRYFLPGNITTQHALFLYNQGRHEEALAKVDQAIRHIAAKPKIFRSIHREETFKTLCGSLRTRTLILTGLGRYDEARQAAHQLQQLAGSDSHPNAALALLEYYCGRLDEALTLAQAVRPEDTHYNSMLTIMAMVHCMKGEFDQALQASLSRSDDITRFYSPDGLKTLLASSTGAKLVELQRRKHAGVAQPLGLIVLAHVYIDKKEFGNAVGALDEAEKSMGPEPGLQVAYCRHRACSFAALKRADEAESYIGRMRAVVQQVPTRSRLWETHFTAGQSYLYLERYSDALAELTKAELSVLHPIEKHATAYWIAQAHEAAGHKREAIPYYQTVAADPIPSWMRKHAAEVLSRQKS